ncbi:SubName: Full=Uncharacterized protein {ECO:0000313/EMBL:CCA67271.1} [Serendipita indica DSM 11827]|uniref:Uncharacterized protein n=1 Tax=Serendipita indica (strain DSM 11827) TaxID=1109443 RepID=G4T7E7_SERID|nr:SubName: Full=Uncharacterized protein {ECO:0000313/EMBL:CCA67271.1} [Serendipita indica DSM 11827]CCA67271.1 hypothetical protein PIIN_01104 [Serendipita indica DSM 11827]
MDHQMVTDDNNQTEKQGANYGGYQARPRNDVQYLYCGVENDIRPREPIRCKACGHRIMYKKRTSKMVQFEAR